MAIDRSFIRAGLLEGFVARAFDALCDKLDVGVSPTAATATAAAGAATLSGRAGTVTSEALTTAAGADYVLTLTNSSIVATSIVLASADNGTNTTEGLAINRVTPGAGSVVIHVRNTNAAAALNGTIKINFLVIN